MYYVTARNRHSPHVQYYFSLLLLNSIANLFFLLNILSIFFLRLFHCQLSMYLMFLLLLFYCLLLYCLLFYCYCSILSYLISNICPFFNPAPPQLEDPTATDVTTTSTGNAGPTDGTEQTHTTTTEPSVVNPTTTHPPNHLPTHPTTTTTTTTHNEKTVHAIKKHTS